MSDIATTTITGTFASRAEADRAIEHLVQQYGLDRADIFVGPTDDANSAGEEVSGGDTGTSPGAEEAHDPALNGEILVSTDLPSEKIAEAEQALRDAGALTIKRV